MPLRRFTFLLLELLPCFIFAQPYLLSVDGGYGEGAYFEGDTVYLFSRAMDSAEVFKDWTFAPIQPYFMANEGEWLCTFIMPAQDLTATANFDTIPTGFLQLELISTATGPQPFYTAFQSPAKGTVFLFHGTNGKALAWAHPDQGDNYQLVKDLYYRGYSVVIPESAESTLGIDLNNDGKIRWTSFPLDAADNVDHKNLSLAIDTFEKRGDLDRSRLYSIGMSSGGGFSGAFSVVFSTVASALYCSSSQAAVVELTPAHLAWCLMPNDLVIMPGAAETARENYELLLERGLCGNYFINQPFPIYPAYFQRASLDFNTSQAIYQEISSNGFTTADDRLTVPTDQITTHIQNHPGQWPTITALTISQLGRISNLLATAFGEHNFFANHNQRTIQFFDDPCGLVSGIDNPEQRSAREGPFSPNPTEDGGVTINLEPPFDLLLLNALGQRVIWQRDYPEPDLILPDQGGVYYLQIQKGSQRYLGKILRQ